MKWKDLLTLTVYMAVLLLLQVNVNLKKAGSKLEHQGIKIEFIGQIGEFSGRLLFLSGSKLKSLVK